jgi:hypothetical protein
MSIMTSKFLEVIAISFLEVLMEGSNRDKLIKDILAIGYDWVGVYGGHEAH